MKIIYLLLIVTFLKGLIFSIVVPIWHTPDEQAHFAQVAFFAEFNKMPKQGFDLNREIFESEIILGTNRDERGNNKFTFHPEYRIEYTNNYQGKYEKEIKKLPLSFRQDLVKNESANYPPLYYWIAAATYKLFYYQDLITRIYLSRLISILMGAGVVFFAWLVAKELFPMNILLQINLPLLVSFQPMFSFISAGVSSDNLINLLFSIMIWLMVVIIKNGVKNIYIITSAFILLLAYLTKPQFLLAIPMFGLAVIFSFLLAKKVSRVLKVIAITISIITMIAVFILITSFSLYEILEKFYTQSFYPGEVQLNLNFIYFIKETLIHTMAEVIPWYWGVFNWLGVTLPRDVNRVINRLMIIAAIGVLIKILLMVKRREREDYLFIFLLAISAIYFLGITFYNYLFMQSHNFPFGIQGRYYFPVIVPHMAILLVGFMSIVPKIIEKYKSSYIKVIGLLMVILNFITLWVIAKSYYDLSSFDSFITQASQYKPVKGGEIIIVFTIYIVTLLVLVIEYLRLNPKQVERKF